MIVFYWDEWVVLNALLHLAVFRLCLHLLHLFVSSARLVCAVFFCVAVDYVWLMRGRVAGFVASVIERGNTFEWMAQVAESGMRFVLSLLLLLFGYLGMCAILKVHPFRREGVLLGCGVLLGSFLLAGILTLWQSWYSSSFGGLALLLLIVNCFVSLFRHRSGNLEQMYRVAIRQNGTTAFCWGFYDTGNRLTDPYFQRPVVLASRAVLAQLEQKLGGAVLVPYYSLGQENGLVGAYRLEELSVEFERGTRAFSNVLVAEADSIFGKNRPPYDLILHQSMRWI